MASNGLKITESEKNENFRQHINVNRISNTKFEKLLGVTLDNRLKLNQHISSICKTASNKLHALARLSNYEDDKKKILNNSYFLSQFN